MFVVCFVDGDASIMVSDLIRLDDAAAAGISEAAATLGSTAILTFFVAQFNWL